MQAQKFSKMKNNPGFSSNYKVYNTAELLLEADVYLGMINHKLKTNHTIESLDLLNKKDEIEEILGDFHSKLLNLKYLD